ncbi:rhomboid-like protein [Nocardia sp. MW-W600-9]
MSAAGSGRARTGAVAVRRWVRSAPGTYLWLAALAVTTAIIRQLPDSEAREWLGHRSTNLHHLAEDPIRVLIGSAFWTDGSGWFAYAVLLWAIRNDDAPARAMYTLDMGVSYALAGVAAVLAYRLVPPWRWLYILGVLAVVLPPVFVHRTFTDVGHASAAAIGFACYPLTRGRGGARDPGVPLRRFRHRTAPG